MTCTFCGDPAVELCTRKHLEWIIVLPLEVKAKDIWRSPLDGKIYSVTELQQVDPDYFRLLTAQDKSFHIYHAQLPLLVRRSVPCGWPRCDLHCGKCMMYRESEERAELLGIDREGSAVRERKTKKKLKATDIV